MLRTGAAHPRHEATAAGFDHHFVKPLDTAHLIALLEQASLARQGGTTTLPG